MTTIEQLAADGFNKLETSEKGDVAGCYVVVRGGGQAEDKALYIGEANRIKAKLQAHDFLTKAELNDCEIFIKPLFNKEKRRILEDTLIKKYAPERNKTFNGRTKYEVLSSFEKWLNQHPITNSTLKTYSFVVERFLNSPYDLNAEGVNTFLKNNPRRFYLVALKYYIKFENRLKNIDIIKQKEPKRKLKNVPTLDRIEELMKTRLDNKDAYWVMRLDYLTAARIAEILNLRLRNIEDDHILFEKTKTGVPRKMWVEPEILIELKKYLVEETGILQNDKCFFTFSKNTHAALMTYRDCLQATFKEDAKTLTRTHNFRRAVLNKILDLTGNNLLMAKEFAGHENIQTTERYATELTKEKAKREAFELLKQHREGKMITGVLNE